MFNNRTPLLWLIFIGYILTACTPQVHVIPVKTPYSAVSDLNNRNAEANVFTPQNAESILNQKVQLNPKPKNTVQHQDRILIRYGDSYMAANNGYGVELQKSLSTYDDLLLNTFYVIKQKSTPCFRLDSEKHSIFSVDYNPSTKNLMMRNNWGYDRDSNSAYLCFVFDSNNQSLAATSRYVFNADKSRFEKDHGFSNSSVYFDSTSSQFQLSSTGSRISIYESGFNFNIPTDFNPNNTKYVVNSRVPWEENHKAIAFDQHKLSGDKIQKDTAGTYQPQIRTPGNDKQTRAAADKMLRQIQTDLEQSGESMRYHPAVYMAFRDGLLNTKLIGATTVNGKIDQNTVPYVFFTNETDGSGKRHPFMVIASYSVSDKPNRLLDVPRPPGDGSRGGYGEQNVTRDAVLQSYLIKIPLKNYGNISQLTDNEMEESLASDVNHTQYDVYNYASISSVGVAVDGVMIYPVLNNMLVATQHKAEITNTGVHVGRGMGLHWHADGHGATGNGLNLYNMADYAGKQHPPLIGFGFDGIALYGKYEHQHHDMDGIHDPLDSFGGHAHPGYSYHYHAHSAPSSVVGDRADYTLHILMKGAWIGKINDIPEFWKRSAPNVAGQKNQYVGIE